MSVRQFTLAAICGMLFFSCDSGKNGGNNSTTTETGSDVVTEPASTPAPATGTPFSVTVTDASASFPGLPGLQSFVLGTSSAGDKWLMLGGRTNGMHSFADYEAGSFPITDFNDNIYVYDLTTQTATKMAVSDIDGDVSLMFKATNLQHFQSGGDLFITGGYGENEEVAPDNSLERWTTYDYMARINVENMITAVEANDKVGLNSSFIYGQNAGVQATGGELFKMGDYFYLTAGHIYKGVFSTATGKPSGAQSQVYLDAVHRFKLAESAGKLVLSDLTKITDGLADNATQFRRRDLPVTPALQLTATGITESVTLYAGVFTAPTNTVAGLAANANWEAPIYIMQDGSYSVDNTYAQQSNVYAAANFVAYDSESETLYTTILGGIMHANTNEFGNEVITINRPLSGTAPVSTATSQTAMPFTDRYGAEANMIYSTGNMVSGISLPLFDITSMTSGETMDIGHFYGGIQALKANPGGYGAGLSFASSKVFKVTITKN